MLGWPTECGFGVEDWLGETLGLSREWHGSLRALQCPWSTDWVKETHNVTLDSKFRVGLLLLRVMLRDEVDLHIEGAEETQMVREVWVRFSSWLPVKLIGYRRIIKFSPRTCRHAGMIAHAYNPSTDTRGLPQIWNYPEPCSGLQANLDYSEALSWLFF